MRGRPMLTTCPFFSIGGCSAVKDVCSLISDTDSGERIHLDGWRDCHKKKRMVLYYSKHPEKFKAYQKKYSLKKRTDKLEVTTPIEEQINVSCQCKEKKQENEEKIRNKIFSVVEMEDGGSRFDLCDNGIIDADTGERIGLSVEEI